MSLKRNFEQNLSSNIRKKVKLSKTSNYEIFITNDLLNLIISYIGSPHSLILINKNHYNIITKNIPFIKEDKIYNNYCEYYMGKRKSDILKETYYPLVYPMVLHGRFFNKNYNPCYKCIDFGSKSKPQFIISYSFLSLFIDENNSKQINNFKTGLYLNLFDNDIIQLIFKYACKFRNYKIINIVIEYNYNIINYKKLKKVYYDYHSTLIKIDYLVNIKEIIGGYHFNTNNLLPNVYYHEYRINLKKNITWNGSILDFFSLESDEEIFKKIFDRNDVLKLKDTFLYYLKNRIRNKDFNTINYFLEKFPDICNIKDKKYKHTILYYAYLHYDINIINLIEKHSKFDKSKHGCVSFSIIHNIEGKKFLTAGKIFKDLLKKKYFLNEKDHLGWTLINKLVIFINDYANVYKFKRFFNDHEKEKVKDKSNDHEKEKEKDKSNDKELLVLFILRRLIELDYGLSLDEKLKDHISTKYSKNILFHSIEINNLELVKFIFRCMYKNKSINTTKILRLSELSLKLSIFMWLSRLGLGSSLSHSRIFITDYIISQPQMIGSKIIINNIYKVVFLKFIEKIQINYKNKKYNLNDIRNNKSLDKEFKDFFWEKFSKVLIFNLRSMSINPFIKVKNNKFIKGLLFMYVLKKYNNYLNEKDKIKHKCAKKNKHDNKLEEVLCSSLRKECRCWFNVVIDQEVAINDDTKVYYKCELDFIKELIPEIKNNIFIYLTDPSTDDQAGSSSQ